MFDHILDFIGNPFDTDNPFLAIMEIIVAAALLTTIVIVLLSTAPIWIGPFLGYRAYKFWQQKKAEKKARENELAYIHHSYTKS